MVSWVLLVVASVVFAILAIMASAHGGGANATEVVEVADFEFESEPEDERESDEDARSATDAAARSCASGAYCFAELIGAPRRGEPSSIFRPPIA